MPRAAEIVYLLCALTSLACAVLLARGYFRSKARILLWSTCCFVLFFINNVLLYLDLVVFPMIDLAFLRALTNLLAVAMLVAGMIWDSD